MQPYVKQFHYPPYLCDMNGVRLPVEDRCIIIHVSDLDVYCVFHHLGGRETPS